MAKNVMHKEIVTPDFDPEFKEYPEDLVVDVSTDVVVGVRDGWVSFEDDENNLVQIEEWMFARFVEIWQKEREAEAVAVAPEVSGERWGVEFKQWSLGDGRMITGGWELDESAVYRDEAEALEHVAEYEMMSKSYIYTRVIFRAVRLG